MAVKSYRELKVWEAGMDLAVEAYRLSERFPKHELFGLCSQLRRAAASIPANIAEGHGRYHLGDYLRHLSIARGSLLEVETHSLLAERLGYLDAAGCRAFLDRSAELGRMLHGLTTKLRSLSPNT